MLRRFPAYAIGLVGLAAVVLVAALGFYAFVTFEGTSVNGHAQYNRRETYSWTGNTLLVEATKSKEQGTCTVKPEQGEERPVQIRTLAGGRHRMDSTVELTPWFSGKAAITCNVSVTVRSGAQIGRFEFSNSPMFLYGTAVVVALPIIALVGISVLRRPRTQRP